MGNPDGGWYDETPPHVTYCTPRDKGTNVNSQKIRIYFDEFIKIDNPTENVIVSPPQIEMPDIKGAGKYIEVILKDSLKPNTTYTIDFSDAISDNNEDNPLGNYTYSFSTGEVIDTMEVSGYVLNSEDLEPVKGTLVGLYPIETSPTPSQADEFEYPDSTVNSQWSIFKTQPLLRVSRTDGSGRFVIKGVAPGSYHIFSLQDADGNYYFSQKSEQISFSDEIIVPSFFSDIRQDTLWHDSLHIKSIDQIHYTHFIPDNIVLRAFTEPQNDRFLIKTERKQANRFTLFFSYGDETLPEIRGLNFDETDAFVIESNVKRDTINYWLRDTLLVNQDTLDIEARYLMTDSTGILTWKTDTISLISKEPYAKRLKQEQRAYEEWFKTQERLRKKDKPYETVMPRPKLDMKLTVPSQLDPDKNISIVAPTPLATLDTTKIHLYVKQDTLWYNARFALRQKETLAYELVGEWRPEQEYSLEIDSAAFVDIYGKASKASKNGFKVRSNDYYSSLLLTLVGMSDTTVVVQLLNGSDAVIKEISTSNGQAEFYYINPGEYFMRLIIDSNKNGEWDTGLYDEHRQAETVYYYPEKIECRAKWDVQKTWNPTERPLNLQKPEKIKKQKADKKRTIKSRNMERAREKGIQYIPGKTTASLPWLLLLAFMLMPVGQLKAQCKLTNTAFKSGEVLAYNMYFNWKFVWLKAGTASMTVVQSNYKGQQAWRTSLITRGNGKADNYFLMRDTLLCYSSMELAPLYYRKGSREGDHYRVDELFYSYAGNKTNIKFHRRHNNGTDTYNNLSYNECVYDMMNVFARARSFNASGWQKGHTINFPIADGNKIISAQLYFRGKTTVKADNGVKYRCLQISYMEKVDGKYKRIADFYVTDDQNHVPIELDMFLKWGAAKAILTTMKGTRSPITSIVK